MNQREITNYWDGQCFGCSRSNAQGLQLRFWLSEQGCFTTCTVPDHLCGFDGLAHGGIIAALLDEVAAWTIIARLGHMGITREMSIRYLKPVPTGRELRVEAQIISHGERNAVLRSTIRATDGTLLAEGESTWALPRLASIARIAQLDEATLEQFVARYSQQERKEL